MLLNFPVVVINPPNDVTIHEGQDAIFTCILHKSISETDVVWYYRSMKSISSTEIVREDRGNISFTMNNNAVNSSLVINNATKSYTGFYWIEISSFNVCNASLTVLTSAYVATYITVKCMLISKRLAD